MSFTFIGKNNAQSTINENIKLSKCETRSRELEISQPEQFNSIITAQNNIIRGLEIRLRELEQYNFDNIPHRIIKGG